MIDILVYLAIFVIVAIVLWYLISQVNLPEPLRTIIVIAIVVVGAVVVISFLLQLTGQHGGLRLSLH